MSEVAGNLAWRAWRLRFLLNKRRTPEELERLRSTAEVSFLPMEAIGERGGLSLEQTRPKEDVQTGFSLFFEDDVVVAKITPCFENCKGALIRGLINGVGFGTTELHVLDPSDSLLPEFLFYLTLSSDFRLLGEASMKGSAGQKRVPDEFLQNFTFRLPSLPEQRQICFYLDRETARIDSMISEKGRMLELLDEKRAALINHAVTRGLDPAVTLRASGESWLGEVPSHWHVVRGKALFREVDDRTPTGEETLLSLRMGKGLVPHDQVSDKPLEASDVVGFKRVSVGQMVINRMRAASGLIAVADQPGLVSPDYAVFEVLSKSLCVEYFLELFKTRLLQAVFRSSSKGLGTGEQGFLRLYSDAFLSLHFPFPPESEQQEIADFVEGERREFERTEALLERSIELAAERRSALISAAVAGRIPLEEMAA